jgi:Ca-activated chloride channel family protein
MRNAFNLALPKSDQSLQNTHQDPQQPSANIPVPHKDLAELRQIIFITDGSVSNEESLMTQIKQNIGESRLFTVGIGSAPNSYFMLEAAKMGKGTFTYIGSTTQVQQKMLALLNKLKHPALTNIELFVGSTEFNNNSNIEIYPNTISDLYLGEPLVLSYRLDPINSELKFSDQNSQQLTLTGNYQNSLWSNNLELKGMGTQSGLNVLWAREKIAQLTRDKRSAAISKHASKASQDEYKSMITETALTHHLVSHYTSLVAVDVTPTKPQHLNAKSKRINNRTPAGATNNQKTLVGRLPQTATNAELKLLIGLILIGLSLCMRLLTKRKV